MVFVICIGIICRYFVGHGSYICILCEAWSLKILLVFRPLKTQLD